MSVPRLNVICILLLFILPGWPGHAQTVSDPGGDREALADYIRKEYGLDQELYRGYLFYDAYFQHLGDPYFPRDAFSPGSLTRNGVLFDGLSLKYDCHAQVLVMEYTDLEGRYNQLIFEQSSIDAFTLGKLNFKKLGPDGGESSFYQVISAGPLSCCIHWKRDAVPLSNNFRYLYEFTDPIGKYFLEYHEIIHPFSGKKSFTALFPPEMAPGIRKYMRARKFSFKRADTGDLEELFNYINDQLE
jgi:hypothetical protein